MSVHVFCPFFDVIICFVCVEFEEFFIGSEYKPFVYRNKDFTGDMMSIKMYLSIITLNVNGLNAPIKWHRVADWIKRQDPSICCLQETHSEPKDTSRLKVKGWRSIFLAIGPQNKAEVAILISDKLDFK